VNKIYLLPSNTNPWFPHFRLTHGLGPCICASSISFN